MAASTRGRRTPATRSVHTVSVATAALLLLVLIASALGSPIADTPDADFTETRTLASRSVSSSAIDQSSQTRTQEEPTATPWWVVAVLGTFVVGIGLMVVWLLSRWVVETVRGRRRDSGPQGPPPILPEAAAATLLEDQARHADALAEGTTDEAVIALWIAVEESVARAGVARAPAETSSELTVRVLNGLHIDHDAVAELAGLYREARFSHHTLSDRDRAAARAALERVHASLRGHTTPEDDAR